MCIRDRLRDENISVAAMKIVIDSIYSGEINVNDENVFEVLTAADHFKLQVLWNNAVNTLPS